MRNETFKNLLLSASLISASAFLAACGDNNSSKNTPSNSNQPISDTNTDLQTLETEITQIKDEKKSLEEQIRALKEKQALKETEEDDKRIQQLQLKLKKTEEDYHKQLAQQKQSQQEEFERVKQDLLAKIEELTNEKDKLKQSYSSEISTLNMQITNMQATIDDNKTEIELKSQELEGINRELTALNGQRTSLVTEKAGLEQQITQLTAQLQNASTPPSQGSNQQAQLQQKIVELQGKVSELESQRQALNPQIALKQSAAISTQTQIEIAKTEIETQTEQLNDSQKKLEVVKADAATQAIRIEEREAAAIEELKQVNMVEDVKKQFDRTLDEIDAKLLSALKEINENPISKYNREVDKTVESFKLYYKPFNKNYNSFAQEITARDTDLSHIKDKHLVQQKQKIKIIESMNQAQQKYQTEANEEGQKVLTELQSTPSQPEQSPIITEVSDYITGRNTYFSTLASTRVRTFGDILDTKGNKLKVEIDKAKNDLDTWKSVKESIEEYTTPDASSVLKWASILSVELATDPKLHDANIDNKYKIVKTAVASNTALTKILNEKLSELKEGSLEIGSFLDYLLQSEDIRNDMVVSRLAAKEGEQNPSSSISESFKTATFKKRADKQGGYINSIKNFLAYHIKTSEDAKYIRTLFADTAEAAFKELLPFTPVAAATPPAATAAQALGLSSTTPRDYSEKVSFFKVRKAVNGFADISGLKVNGASGESIALGMPLFVQLNGDVSSSKATDAATGSVAYRLGNTVIGAIQSYANSGEGFGVDGRQLETSIVASQSFGSFFVEGQLGTVSATDVYNSSWKGMRSQVILGLDTEFVSPFVQITHRQLDRSGINLNQTTGYLGLEMDVAKLHADSYSVDARLTAKVGYGAKAWSIKATDIGTTTGFNGSVEWSGTLNLNSGVKFTTNLGLDTVAGSSAAVNVSLDR